MDEIQVCASWEEIEENSSILDQQLEKLRLQKAGGEEPKIRILARNKTDKGAGESNTRKLSPPSTMVLDSTTEESLRSQYVPPQPKITLLARPKLNNTQGSDMNGPSSKSKAQPVKTLEQREKEYMEARKRILGDVQFDEVDDELSSGSDCSGLSPAEVLKQKVAQAMKQKQVEGDVADGVSEEDGKTLGGSGESETVENPTTQPKSKSKGKRNREKFKTSNPESPRDFPIPKTETEKILRQPRGPDGTSGFHR